MQPHLQLRAPGPRPAGLARSAGTLRTAGGNRAAHAHPRHSRRSGAGGSRGTPPRCLGLARCACARVGVGGRGATSAGVCARAPPGALPRRPARLGPGARHEGRAGRRGWGRGPEGPERQLPSPSRSWARAAAVPAAAVAAAAGEDGGAGGRSGWSGALFPGLAPALSLAPLAPAGPRTQLSGKVPQPGTGG